MSEVDQSVETNDIPVVEESAPQAESSGTETQESAPEKQEERIGFNDPKHPDHGRFKELLDGQREYKQKFEQAEQERASYRQSIEQMQRELHYLRTAQAPKKEEPKDPFLADLEKVNPAYAKSFQSVMEQAAKTAQLEQKLARYEQQQDMEKGVSHFNGLLESNKVSDPTERKLYERYVAAEVYELRNRGEKVSLKDLDKIFNGFHDEYKKAMDARDRATTAKYSTAKKADLSPKGATGGAATAPVAKKFKSLDSPDTAAWLAKEIRAMKKQD